MEPMPPQRQVQAAASPDGAAANSPSCSPGESNQSRQGESLRRQQVPSMQLQRVLTTVIPGVAAVTASLSCAFYVGWWRTTLTLVFSKFTVLSYWRRRRWAEGAANQHTRNRGGGFKNNRAIETA